MKASIVVTLAASGSVALSGLVAPAAVQAQQDEPETRLIDEIIVTATKRESSVRDLPVSIQAFTGESLIDQGLVNLEDIVKLSPGVTKNANRVVMRGVGTTALGTFVTSEEVGRFFGDISLNAPSVRGALADLDPWDMQTVELLKGPQGSLFGGSALAGAVRYVPQAPADQFESRLRFGVGGTVFSDEFNEELAAMVNVPIMRNLAVRAAGTYRERGGAINDLYNGLPDIEDKRTKQGRALLSWQPLEKLSLDLTWLAWEESLDHNGFTDRPNAFRTEIKRIKEPGVMKSRVLNVRADYDFEPLTLSAFVNHLETSWFSILDLAPLLGTEDAVAQTPYVVPTSADVPSLEVRIVSSRPVESRWAVFNNWDYLLGFYQMQAEQHVDAAILGQTPTLPFGIPGLSGEATDARAQTDVEETALFFDLARTFFGQSLELNLGGRLAWTQVDSYTFSDVEGQETTPESNSIKDRRINPKLSASWIFNDALSIYASASQGFRFGGVNADVLGPADDIPRSFDSDSLWNYELGVRSDWAGGRIQWDTTAYRIDWTDLQITQVSSEGLNFVTNVGGATILGIESGVVASLGWGLTLTGGAAYIDARISEFFESENGPVEAGTRLPLTAYLSGNISLNWSGQVGIWQVDASLSQAYSGSRKNELINTLPLPGFRALGGSIRLENPALRYRPVFAISGTNLLNEIYPHFGFPAVTGDEEIFILARPRTVIMSLEFSF